MTNGSGGGATAVAYSNLPALNTPFGFSQQVIIDDTGNESGAAFGNATNYPSVQFTGGLLVTASTPIVLTAGNLTVSVPASLSGTLDVCSPDNFCAFGGGASSNVFDVNFATPGILTVTFAQFNFGSTYTLTSAEFTSTPEPGTWLLAPLGIALVGLRRLLRLQL